ncbi:MAG: trigger factor [Magnetococcales bacterium]|nr:trigger factor [Magnetococcales bacterium]
MEVTVEETGTLERTIRVRVEAEKVNELLDLELYHLAGQVKLPGFRPGKAPKKHLETRFKEHIGRTILERLMQEGLQQARAEYGLNPADTPEVTSVQLPARNQEALFTFNMQIMPTVEPQGFRGMALTRPVAEVTEADLASALEKVRSRHARFEKMPERSAQTGDQVVLDFKGFVDNEPFEGGEAEGFVLELGSGRFIPGFEEQLVGCAAGEKREITVTFPEQYVEHLAGKTALFHCTVQEVRARILPEIDDALAALEQIQEGGLEQLKEQLRTQLQRQADNAGKKRLNRQIHDGLVAANPFALPSKLVAREAESMVAQFKEESQARGVDPQMHGLTDAVLMQSFQDTADRRLRLGLLIAAIAKEVKLSIDDARVAARLDTLAANYGAQAHEFKQWVRADESRMDGIRGSVLEEMVNEWILANGTVTEETLALEALLTES